MIIVGPLLFATLALIVLVSSGERNARDDILTKLAAVLDEVGTERIRSVGLGQTRLQSCKSVRISETSDGNWRAEEEFEEDGLIIYLTIKYHQHYHPRVKYSPGLLSFFFLKFCTFRQSSNEKEDQQNDQTFLTEDEDRENMTDFCRVDNIAQELKRSDDEGIDFSEKYHEPIEEKASTEAVDDSPEQGKHHNFISQKDL